MTHLNIEKQFLQCVRNGNCADVRDLLEHSVVAPEIWQEAFDHSIAEDNVFMIQTLMENIDINSISQDTAVVCVAHRLDSVVDQIVQNSDLNHQVRQQLAFVISISAMAGEDVSYVHESLAYMDQRVSAVQKHAIEQQLDSHYSGAAPKRL